MVRMRVCISNKYGTWDNSVTGKGKFALRLISAMQSLGAHVTTDHEEPVDVDMQFSRLSYEPNKHAVSIVRQGPVALDINSNYQESNKGKWKAVKQADGVIYQSNFCQKMGHRIVGKPKCAETVIHNGADPVFYRNCKPRHSLFKENFVAVAREWLPQKRLQAVVEAFRLYRASTGIDACLWIAGNTGNQLTQEDVDIKAVGNLSDEELGGLYRIATALIHLVWIDACPNVVVEALVAGCPVICTNHGGTHELLATQEGVSNGIVCINDELEYLPVVLNRPPKVHIDAVVDAMKEIGNRKVDASRLHIENIAKQYLAFFEEVLRQRKK